MRNEITLPNGKVVGEYIWDRRRKTGVAIVKHTKQDAVVESYRKSIQKLNARIGFIQNTIRDGSLIAHAEVRENSFSARDLGRKDVWVTFYWKNDGLGERRITSTKPDASYACLTSYEGDQIDEARISEMMMPYSEMYFRAYSGLMDSMSRAKTELGKQNHGLSIANKAADSGEEDSYKILTWKKDEAAAKKCMKENGWEGDNYLIIARNSEKVSA